VPTFPPLRYKQLDALGPSAGERGQPRRLARSASDTQVTRAGGRRGGAMGAGRGAPGLRRKIGGWQREGDTRAGVQADREGDAGGGTRSRGRQEEEEEVVGIMERFSMHLDPSESPYAFHKSQANLANDVLGRSKRHRKHGHLDAAKRRGQDKDKTPEERARLAEKDYWGSRQRARGNGESYALEAGGGRAAVSDLTEVGGDDGSAEDDDSSGQSQPPIPTSSDDQLEAYLRFLRMANADKLQARGDRLADNLAKGARPPKQR
jgi:hypothetical protein